jgi:drug/metabolite transporter (DMT)-like permease
MKSNIILQSKGISLAFLSMLLGSMATIMYKPIMADGVSPITVGLIESGGLSLFLLSFCRPWRIFKSSRRIVSPIILASLCQGVGSLSFIFGLSLLDPVTFSFLSRNQAIFSILLGCLFLNERHNSSTWVFIILAVLGSFVICYADLNIINLQGLLFALLFCLSFSLRNFVVRKHRRTPIMISIFYGYLFSFLILLLIGLFNQKVKLSLPDIKTTIKITSIAFFAVLGTLYFFQLSSRYEKLSVITPIRLFSPFIVTLYFGWEIDYNYSPAKSLGIFIMAVSILSLAYSYIASKHVKTTKPNNPSN